MRKTLEQELNEQKARIDRLEYTARMGTVTTVDRSNRTVRVSWLSGNRSGDMKILRLGEPWIPEIGDMVISIHRPGGDGWIIGRL
ncbi:MAG: hypothetical protein Q4P20_06680 [Eubacteriales bacterium]|nr:hypothetical protein [Eubacteriales bacterium]